jgi:hypothetical protein
MRGSRGKDTEKMKERWMVEGNRKKEIKCKGINTLKMREGN